MPRAPRVRSFAPTFLLEISDLPVNEGCDVCSFLRGCHGQTSCVGNRNEIPKMS
jgi:hypothetical protein